MTKCQCGHSIVYHFKPPHSVSPCSVPNCSCITFKSASFSFVEHAVGYQSFEQTLSILTYELGHVIEYNHKARIYDAAAYYSDANQQKEMSDLISMARYYCEQKGWDYGALEQLGEEGYLERMEDIREHGLNSDKS